jgi:pyrroline-5-carboxylate reductase
MPRRLLTAKGCSVKIGIVGTGFIAEAIVRGLSRGAGGPSFVLSPRNPETASRLARDYPLAVTKATSNQEVVDCTDIVFLSVRPAIAVQVIGSLRFRAEQTVVSVIAGIQLSELREMVSPATTAVLAIPLPAMSQGKAPLVLMPDNLQVRELFSATGPVVAVANEEAYAALGTVTAIMAPYFDVASKLTCWLTSKGVSREMASMYISGLLSGLAETASRAKNKTFEDLVVEHATPGSFNERLLQHLFSNTSESAVTKALDPLLARMLAS